MTILDLPVRGPEEAQTSDYAQCALLSTNSVDERLALKFLFQYINCNAPDNANAYAIQASILALKIPGLKTEVWLGDPMLLAAQVVPQGKYVIVGVNCTPDCVPVTYNTDIRHWLALYSTLGDCYNCWFSLYQRYTDLSQCHNYLMGNVVIWFESPLVLLPKIEGESVYEYTHIRKDGSMHSYQFTGPGTNGVCDVWHKWWPKDQHFIKSAQGNERIGQDGSTNKGWGTDLDFRFGFHINYDPDNAVTIITAQVGDNGSHQNVGLQWLAAQGDGAGSWIGYICK